MVLLLGWKMNNRVGFQRLFATLIVRLQVFLEMEPDARER